MAMGGERRGNRSVVVRFARASILLWLFRESDGVMQYLLLLFKIECFGRGYGGAGSRKQHPGGADGGVGRASGFPM